MSTIINGIEFIGVNNDVNGNPRYLVHFLRFIKESESELPISEKWNIANRRAKKVGFKIYQGKQYGGMYVGTSYDLRETANEIKNMRKI